MLRNLVTTLIVEGKLRPQRRERSSAYRGERPRMAVKEQANLQRNDPHRPG